MPSQIGAVVTALVDLPTAQGRVQSGAHGFARNVIFVSQRQKQAGRKPEDDPSIEFDIGKFVNLMPSETIQGVTLKPIVVPRNMKLDEWVILGGNSALVSEIQETTSADPLARISFFLPRSYTTPGQNISTGVVEVAPPSGGGLASAPSSAPPVTTPGTLFQPPLTYPVPYNVLFCSKWQLSRGQGWYLRDTHFATTNMIRLPMTDWLKSVGFDVHAPGTFTLKELALVISVIAEESLQYQLTKMSQAVGIQWGIGGSSGIQWQLVIPKDHNADRNAILYKSVDGGNTFKFVDDHPTLSHGIDNLDRFGPSNGQCTFHVESGTAVFELGHEQARWTCRDPDDPVNGFVSPEGAVAIQWYGTGGTLLFNPLGWNAPDSNNLLGFAWAGPFTLPSWVNPAAGDLSFKLYPVDAAGNNSVSTPDVTVNAYEVPGRTLSEYYLRVDFVKNGGGNQIPVLLAMQEIRQPIIDVNTSNLGDLGVAELVEWEQTHKFRGSTARIEAKNETGQWSPLGGNEVVKVDVAQITGSSGGNGTPGTAYRQFTGQIEADTLVQSPARYPNTPGMIEVDLYDLTGRLAAKKMIDMPAFGGWRLADAMAYVLARSGVDEDFYDTSGIPASVVLKSTAVVSGKGHLSYFYDDMCSVIHGMDEMTNAQGFEWGVGADGIVRFWTIGSWDTSHTYTLNDTTFDPGVDNIRLVKVKRGVREVYNTVIVHAKDANGIDRAARVWYYDSIYGTYGDPGYLGDDRWYTHHAPPGADPMVVAQALLANLSSGDVSVEWETDLGQLQLMPRQKVTVNLTNQGVAPGTVLMVVKKSGRIDVRGGKQVGRLTFLLERPKRASGGLNS